RPRDTELANRESDTPGMAVAGSLPTQAGRPASPTRIGAGLYMVTSRREECRPDRRGAPRYPCSVSEPTSVTAPPIVAQAVNKTFRVPEERTHTLKERALHPLRRTRHE